MTTCWKNARLDQRKTAFEFRCEVARNSPEGEKSKESGAFLNFTQSTREPVTMSQTRMLQSIELHSNHLESGYEKQMSLILFSPAFGKCLTFLRPDLAFSNVIERSEVEKAIRSFCLL